MLLPEPSERHSHGGRWDSTGAVAAQELSQGQGQSGPLWSRPVAELHQSHRAREPREAVLRGPPRCPEQRRAQNGRNGRWEACGEPAALQCVGSQPSPSSPQSTGVAEGRSVKLPP